MTDTAFFTESAETARELIVDFGKIETVTFNRQGAAGDDPGVPSGMVSTDRTAWIAEDQLSSGQRWGFTDAALQASSGLVHILPEAWGGAAGLSGFTLTASDDFTLNGATVRVQEIKTGRQPGEAPFVYVALYKGGAS